MKHVHSEVRRRITKIRDKKRVAWGTAMGKMGKKIFCTIQLVTALLTTGPLVYSCTEQNSCQPGWLTIFVHGTFGLRHNINFSTLSKLWHDDIDNTSYKAKVETGRTDPYFYFLQPIQERGLKEILLDSPTICRGPEIFAQAYDTIAREDACYEPTKYYTFGWSGLLSAKKRLLEAHDLYEQLKYEREIYKQKHGVYPKIKLIGYSHGGNVCLNLANARKAHAADNFIIDTLILLGTPVQDATCHLIYEPIFKKIYHIYSSGDCLQRLDLFSPCNFFSHKKFKGDEERPLPAKLTQIRIAISEQSRKTDQKTRRRISKAPGHIELWFFGWTPSLYRKSFPFYPLPFAVFIPYVISLVNQYMPNQAIINFQIKPDLNCIFMKSPIHDKMAIPFLPCKKLEALQNKALAMHPHYFFTQDRAICREFDPTPEATGPSSFAELVKEVYPQIQKKNHNGKTASYFLTCAGAAKSNAL